MHPIAVVFALLQDPLVYRLELVETEPPLVAIEVELDGELDGRTRLGFGDWGGLEEAGRELELVQVSTARGGATSFERATPSEWTLVHPGGERVTARFELQQTKNRANPAERSHYRPILEPELLHVIGSNVLPAPLDSHGGGEIDVRLEWRGFRERGWRTSCSFAPGGDDCELRIRVDTFRHAVFLAGAFAVEERNIQGQLLHVAVWGEDWGTPLEEFADLCAHVVEMERDFFADFDHPRYLISLIPIGEKNPSTVTMGGTGLTDSFALFLPPGAALDAAPSEGMSIPWLLAHEMFHDWNGHAIRLAQPERRGYWFSEGFSDFYARRLLLRAGLVTEEEYVELWNRRLAEYATNPERNATAARIDEAFWSVPSVGHLPYQRGDLVALLVDRAIARCTHGKRSLDDLMLELFARARAGESAFDVDELLAAIAVASNDETAALVRSIVVDGADVVLGPDFDLRGYRIEAAEYAVSGPGGDGGATVAGFRVAR